MTTVITSAAPTAGPWTCSGFTIVDKDGLAICQVSEATHDSIDLDSPNLPLELPIAEANAYLIAAAPELLEACHLALRLWGTNTPEGIAEARDGLMRAIAKAESPLAA